MKQPLRKTLVVAACLAAYLNTTICYASDSLYMQQVQQLKSSIDEFTSHQLEAKFIQAIFSERSYTAEMQKKLQEGLDKLATKSQDLEEQQAQLKEHLNQANINGFRSYSTGKIIWDRLAHELSMNIKQTRQAVAAIQERQRFFTDFCTLYPELVQRDAITYRPSNFGVNTGVDYTRYGSTFGSKPKTHSDWFFSEDPLVEAETIIASSAALLISLGTISFIYGVLPTSFLSLAFSQSGVSLGVNLSIGGSGAASAGAGAAMMTTAAVVVAVAIIYSEWRTDEENKKRKKEAKEKYQNEIRMFEEAQAWYSANKISQDQLVTMAKQTCLNPTIQDSLKAYQDNFKAVTSLTLDKISNELTSLEKTLQDNEKAIQGEADTYLTQLKNTYTNQIFSELQKEVKDKQDVSSIWLAFNEQIKPLVDKHMSDSLKVGCSRGAHDWSGTKNTIHAIFERFQEINRSAGVLEAETEVIQRTNRMIENLDKRFLACKGNTDVSFDF